MPGEMSFGSKKYGAGAQLELGEDGRWFFISVHSSQDAADVQQLLLVKKCPPRRKTA